jgi:hypothetical protein
MTYYTSSENFQNSENDFPNSSQNSDKKKRKRITHFLVDKPLHYPFPIEKEHESVLSIG